MTSGDHSANPRPPIKEPETAMLVLARIVHRLGYLAEQVDTIERGQEPGLDFRRLCDEGIGRLRQIRAAVNCGELDDG